MDDGGGDGGGSFIVKHGSDAAEATEVHKVGAGEVGDVVGEREMRIKSITPILRTGALEVKVVEDALLKKCSEGSQIFFIWADRPIMMNSVLEGLRQRRLYDIEMLFHQPRL